MTQELRRLAEAATQGEWTSENVRGAGIQMRVPYKGTTRMTFTEVFRALPEKEWDAELWANAKYIAAANPAAILGLLDRLEKAEKDAERYRWLRGRFRASWLNNHIPPIRGHELVEAPAVIYIDLPRRTRASGLPSKYEVDPARIDTAIDSAMEASK